MIPVGRFWNGDEFVISTATTAPKVNALAAHPDVALAIGAGNTPGGARSLSVRGRTDVEIVDGVVPEYLAAARRTMNANGAAEFEQKVRRMYLQIARIAVTPTWVRFYDFGAGRMPHFLQEPAEQSSATAKTPHGIGDLPSSYRRARRVRERLPQAPARTLADESARRPSSERYDPRGD